MSMGTGEWSMFPNGNITVSTIVKQDTTSGNEGYVLQCTSSGSGGDLPFGIAGPFPHIMAIAIQGVQLDDGLAGVAGGPAIKIYGPGASKVPLRVSAAVVQGNRLISDANGYGTPSTSNGDHVIAVARQDGPANSVVLVDVIPFDRGS